MGEIIGFILVLAVSIGLGSVLSWYMGIKLMTDSDRVKKMMKTAMTEYTKVTLDVATEAAKAALKEEED